MSDNQPVNSSPNMFFKKKPLPLAEWFFVRFDNETIHWQVNPPGSKPWEAHVRWDSIIRICFRAADLHESDEIYIFTSERPESYVIPTEASGGSDVWEEILSRKLFDAELAIKAMSSVEGLFCTPLAEEEI